MSVKFQKTNLSIIELKKENQDLKVNECGLPATVYQFLLKKGFNAEIEAAEIEQTLKKNDRAKRDLENSNAALKKCMILNSQNFDVACQKCKEKPRRSEQVIVYPQEK